MPVFLKFDEAKYALLARVVKVLLGVVILIMLFAGLRPYASYSEEWVTLDSNKNHTVLRHYGLAISIGNAPDGSHGWAGNRKNIRFESTLKGRTPTQYKFDKNNLPTIDDSGDAARSLTAPKTGHFPDRAWIGALRLDQLLHNNLRDVIINFSRFMPFGFLMCSALPFRSRRHSGFKSAAITIIAGFLVSRAIESAQLFIPGRSHHARDLLLNTMGAAAGAFSLLIIVRLWQLTVSKPPEHVPSRNPENP